MVDLVALVVLLGAIFTNHRWPRNMALIAAVIVVASVVLSALSGLAMGHEPSVRMIVLAAISLLELALALVVGRFLKKFI